MTASWFKRAFDMASSSATPTNSPGSPRHNASRRNSITTTERYRVDLPEPPPGSYGNDLDPEEWPHNVVKRPWDFSIEESLRDRASASATDSENGGTKQEESRVNMLTPYTVHLPEDYISSIKLSPAQVHALDVGVGMVSMDHRWIGRLTFRENGTAVVTCRRSWTGIPVFDLIFRPDEDTTGGTDGPCSSKSANAGQAAKRTRTTFPPTRFPRMRLVGLTRETHPDRYRRAPYQPASAAGTATEQERLIEVAKAELDDAIPILKILLQMRPDLDAGTV